MDANANNGEGIPSPVLSPPPTIASLALQESTHQFIPALREIGELGPHLLSQDGSQMKIYSPLLHHPLTSLPTRSLVTNKQWSTL